VRNAPSSPAPEDDTVTVDTRFGSMTVPRKPKRVVSIYDTSADFALVLGLPLVALGGGGPAGRDLAEYQRGLGLDDLPKFSAYPEVEIETLLTFDPDLVLDDFALDDEQAKKVAAAVPVFAFKEQPGSTVDWRVLLRQMATVFGAEAAAEAHIAAYDERVATLKELLRARWAGATFAYVGPYGDGTYYIAQANMTTNQVMHDDLGFAFAKAVPPTVEERQVDVSMERLDELNDADLLLLRTNPREDGTGVDEKSIRQFVDSPLWQRLPAVQKKQSFLIPGDLFYTSPRTPGANLDWIEKNLIA
jgi:iron complex transport system substrate-binding protein